MARKLRVQFPGAIYHVINRGDRREDIFRDKLDYESFLRTLADVCTKTGWHVHAFCLMPNHFHLVVETPQPNLVAGMKWFLGTYTARFNRRHKLTGHVFAGRYKSLLVGGEGGYLRTVCDYVHLNPVRAKLLALDAPLRSYPWSSFPLFVGKSGQQTCRVDWLRVDRLFGECGIVQDSPAGRREFERRLEARRAGETVDGTEEYEAIRRSWCFGDDSFRKELLVKVEGKLGVSHYGAELQEVAEAKANRIVIEELRVANWVEDHLRALRKGHPGKIQIARRLRKETTVTLQWIAARLHMGTRTHLSHLLYWKRRAELEGNADISMKLPVAKGVMRKGHSGEKRDVRPGKNTKQRWPNEQPGERRSESDPSRHGKPDLPRNDLSQPLTDPFDVSIPLTDPFDTRFD